MRTRQKAGNRPYIMPAKAGIQGLRSLDSRLRGNDNLKKAPFETKLSPRIDLSCWRSSHFVYIIFSTSLWSAVIFRARAYFT